MSKEYLDRKEVEEVWNSIFGRMAGLQMQNEFITQICQLRPKNQVDKDKKIAELMEDINNLDHGIHKHKDPHWKMWEVILAERDLKIAKLEEERGQYKRSGEIRLDKIQSLEAKIDKQVVIAEGKIKKIFGWLPKKELRIWFSEIEKVSVGIINNGKKVKIILEEE